MAANKMIENNFPFKVKEQPEWFYKTLRRAKTIDGDYVRVLSNITKETNVRKLVMDKNSISQIDARDCGWTPTKRFTFDSKLMSVRNYKINEEQCLQDLDSLYSEMIFNSIGANKDKWPAVGEPESLESAIMFHLQNSLANDIERIIWGGEGNEVAGIHDGIVDKLAASADSIKVENAVTIDSSNVLTEIGRVYDAIPDNVLYEGMFDPKRAGVKIFVSLDIYRYLMHALSTVPTEYLVQLPSFTKDGDKIFYMGIEIVVVGLPANTMVAASRDNLVFLTDLLSDTTEIDAQMGQNAYDRNVWYVVGNYRANSDVIFDDECVLYQVD